MNISLNDYSGVLQALFAGFMVILTALYVYFTKKILESNRRTLETVLDETWHSTRAMILVQPTFRDKDIFALKISNEGKSVAKNVEFHLDRDLPYMFDSKQKINDFFLFSEKIPTVPPHSVYRFDLWPGYAAPGEGCPEGFRITARYETMGRNVEETTIVPLKIWLGQPYPARRIEESLEKIDQRLEEIVKFLNNISFKLRQFLDFQTSEYSKAIRESRKELVFDPFEKAQQIEHPAETANSEKTGGKESDNQA